MNELGAAELADLPPEQLVRMVEERLDPSLPATLFGGRVGLTDALVHQQDIRGPLGRPRQIPPERLRLALSFALTAPQLRGAWRARGLASSPRTSAGATATGRRSAGPVRPCSWPCVAGPRPWRTSPATASRH